MYMAFLILTFEQNTVKETQTITHTKEERGLLASWKKPQAKPAI